MRWCSGGVLTNLDSVVQMTELGYSAAGSWNDADMLQLCTYGEGATRHWNSTGLPDDQHGLGLTLVEYTSHLSLWAVLGSPLIHSADLRTVGQRHPECLELMLNEGEGQLVCFSETAVCCGARGL